MARRDVTIAAAITTFNQARYLPATLDSVLAQTRPADEIVVIDDGSTDATADILAAYSSRVRVIRQTNGGVAAARNRAVLESRSEFVALLDGDDLWLPGKLERCAEAIDMADNPRVVVHDIETVSDDGGDVIRRAPLSDFLARSGHSPAPALLEAWPLLLDTNFIWTTSQALVHREAYISAGLSDVRFRIASDYDLYLRLAERGLFLVIPEVLARWRQHDDSASGAKIERHFNWGIEKINVLRTRASAADASRREALRRASSEQLIAMARQTYLLENAIGSWRAAVWLLRISVRCRSPWCATLAIGMLMPPRIRGAAASLTGRRLW